MKLSFKNVIWSLAVAAALLGGAAWFFWAHCCPPMPFDSSPYIVASSTPLTLEQARQQQCPIELPEGAGNISFAVYREWIAVEVYVRFEAPLDVCKAHAIYLLKKHNKEEPELAVPAELRTLKAPVAPIKLGPPLNVKWFDVDAINNGFCAGDTGSHRPRIWIDSDRNIFYYAYTD